MAYEILNRLQPQCFFKWFGAICEIPHGSGKEQNLVGFIRAFGEERGYFCETDEAGNLFMKVPATAGYENEAPVLFQAHTDMVWAKDDGIDFDFEKEPLRLRILGDDLYADGTTLGADNGVGIATMLALADGSEFPHPPLEFLFTVSEEIGLLGVRKFDMSKIMSRRMINMDCGSAHELCITTAGSIKSCIERRYVCDRRPEDFCGLSVTVGGGRGGHSGIMIAAERMCAVNTAAALFQTLSVPYRIISVGPVTSAIARECTVTVAVPSAEKERTVEELEGLFAEIKNIYEAEDPDIFLMIEDHDAGYCLGEADSRNLMDVLSILHTGSYRRSGELTSCVITSGSIVKVILDKGNLEIRYFIRSSNDRCGEILWNNYQRIMDKYGFELEKTDQYSGWPERTRSDFRDKFRASYLKIMGREPEHERIHGGVEIGIIAGAIPDMDGVGYAPTAHGAHSPQEHLYIPDVQVYWDVLTDVLRTKAGD